MFISGIAGVIVLSITAIKLIPYCNRNANRHSTILKMETITGMIQISDVRKKYGKNDTGWDRSSRRMWRADRGNWWKWFRKDYTP